MKSPTILLLCATAIGAIAFHPSAASADVVFSTGRQGTSISIGNSRPVYQPVIIEQRNPEWRYREEERLRKEHRLTERRERERLAERQEQQRLAERREREQIVERRQNEERIADRNSNNYQRNNSSNNNRRDRY
jgi:hypothetical protein